MLWPILPIEPTTEVILTMRPQRALVIPRRQALLTRYRALRFVSITSLHSSAFMRIRILSRVMPALFTNASGAPYSVLILLTTSMTLVSSATFRVIPRPPLPAA